MSAPECTHFANRLWYVTPMLNLGHGQVFPHRERASRSRKAPERPESARQAAAATEIVVFQKRNLYCPRCPRAGSERLESLDADGPSFGKLPKASENFRRTFQNFPKTSIPFQFFPKISPLNLDISRAYDRNLRVCPDGERGPGRARSGRVRGADKDVRRCGFRNISRT